MYATIQTVINIFRHCFGIVMEKKIKTSTVVFILSGVCLLIAIVLLLLEKGDWGSGTESVNSTISTSNEQNNDVNVNVSDGQTDISIDMSVETEVSASDDAEITSSEHEPEPEPIPLVENPYKEYYLANSDMAGWLKIPDTIVDFPVMWTPGDENYYLLKGFDKKKSSNGCLILDTDSSLDPLSTNLIIHGHNNPHAMFGELDKYEKEDYMKEHRYIYLYDKNYEHIYEVMAVFRSKVFYKTDVCFKYYKFFNASNEEEFNDFYDNVKEMSYYDTGVTASFGDHLITLSTCSYHTENGRFVIVAKETEPGEYYEPFEINNENGTEE